MPSAERGIVLGRYAAESDAVLFERVTRAVSAAGYAPQAQPARGSITTESHTRTRRGAARIDVQVYREGWVLVRAVLPARGNRIRPYVDEETTELALAMRRALEGASR